MTDTSDTRPGISLTDFARMCDVTVAAVTNWRARFDDFPAAIDPTAHRLKYERRLLVRWAQEHGKLAPSVYRRKHRLFDEVQGALAEVAPAATATDVLAAAAVLVLLASRGDEYDDALLGPAREIYDQLDDAFLDAQAAKLADDFNSAAHRIDAVGKSIDALRRDYAFQSRAGSWGDDPALAEVALDLGGVAATVVDPCCGIGTSLTLAGRRLTTGTALIGRDADPLRLAVASALLQAEQVQASLSLGDSFDSKFTRSCREQDGSVLVLATPPDTLDDLTKRKATKKWLTLLTSTLREPDDSTVTVVTTPAVWLSRSFLERGDERRPLLDQQRVDAAIIVTTTADGRRSEAGITRIVGPRDDAPSSTLLLADLTYVPAEHLHASVSALITRWDADRAVADRFAKVAQAVTSEEVRAIGALVPQKYRQGHPVAEAAPVEQPTTEPDEDQVRSAAGRRNAPSRDRKAALDTRSSADGGSSTVLRPEPFEVPVEALEQFIAAGTGRGAPLPERTPETRTFHDAVGDGDVLVFSALSGRGTELPGDLVELVTSSKGFGAARRRSADDVEKSDHRRGAVYLQPTEQGTSAGVTVDFLLAWFASAQLQAELRSMARAGRHRLSLSIHDVIDIRADFPDAAECARIAGEWAEVREVRRFMARLDHLVRYRREHLLDRPSE